MRIKTWTKTEITDTAPAEVAFSDEIIEIVGYSAVNLVQLVTGMFILVLEYWKRPLLLYMASFLNIFND